MRMWTYWGSRYYACHSARHPHSPTLTCQKVKIVDILNFRPQNIFEAHTVFSISINCQDLPQ